MNWREVFLTKLDSLSPFGILTYESENRTSLSKLFQDNEVLSYLNRRLVEIDPNTVYNIQSFNDFYGVVMVSLYPVKNLLSRLIYAIETNKLAYVTANFKKLNKQEQLQLQETTSHIDGGWILKDLI